MMQMQRGMDVKWLQRITNFKTCCSAAHTMIAYRISAE
jgi:hypothetical protein